MSPTTFFQKLHSKFNETLKNSKLSLGNPTFSTKVRFSDLDGFEDEVEFLRKNILIPYVNEKVYTKSGTLSLPLAVIFHGNSSGHGHLAWALVNEINANRKLLNSSERFTPKCFATGDLDQILETSGNPSKEEQIQKIKRTILNLRHSRSILITTTKDFSSVPSSLLSHKFFSLTYECPEELSIAKKKTILKCLTTDWEEFEAKPSPQLIESIAINCGLNGDLDELCRNVYKGWMLNKLEGKVRRITERDWISEVEQLKGKLKLKGKKEETVSEKLRKELSLRKDEFEIKDVKVDDDDEELEALQCSYDVYEQCTANITLTSNEVTNTIVESPENCSYARAIEDVKFFGKEERGSTLSDAGQGKSKQKRKQLIPA